MYLLKVYCIPAGWLWGGHGFLYQLGVVDIAGSGGVHLGILYAFCVKMISCQILGKIKQILCLHLLGFYLYSINTIEKYQRL